MKGYNSDRGKYNCMSFQSNTSSQETKYHDHNIHIDYSMLEGSFLFPCFMRNSVNIIEKGQTTQTSKGQKDKET
jgi:hypothetical protein